MRSFTPIAAAVALVSALAAGNANADSFFWAINQFQTIQKLNGDTGAVVDSFAIPGGGGSGASVAIVGANGYYTNLGDTNIHKFDLATHASLGIAFTINHPTAGYTNGITTDASGNLWFADGNAGALQEYSTSGTFLGSHAFPTAASSYRDGSVVFGNNVVTNRGDQTGPYDLYHLDGTMNGALTLVTSSFITTTASGSNGIAFNGTNFYTSDEQAHKVSKWDINGHFVSIANLDPGSRYENWTFASQDIRPAGVPEPATWGMMVIGFGGLGAILRRRRPQLATA